MDKKELLRKIELIAKNVATKLELELVDIEFLKESGSYYLRVYYHKQGGINLDDCQEASHLLSDELDKNDFIKQAYFLEVSSPGLDRPIKTDKDINRNLGQEVEVSLFTNVEGKKKHIGILKSFTNEDIMLSIENKELCIPRQSISLMRIHIKF